MLYKDAISETIKIVLIQFIPLILLSLILIIIGILALKKDLLQKKWATVIMIIGVIILSYAIYYLTCVGMDIKNESYITYNGDIEITSMIGWSGCPVHVEGDRPLSNYYYHLPEGNYRGKVVYTQHSKFVVYMDIDSCE